MPFRKNFYIIFSKGQILRIFRLKICPNFRCAGVRIPDNPRKHPLASICFQPKFFDKKSPDSLWNLGLSDLHLLRSEKVARTRVLVFASQKRGFFAEPPVSELPTAFGSNANLILRRFARRASFEATSAPANAKRTPIGVLCVGWGTRIRT